MNLHPWVSDLRGFTLIELIATVTILALVLVPVLTLFTASFRNQVEAQDKTIALALAQSGMEDLKAQGFSVLSAMVGEIEEELEDGDTLYLQKILIQRLEPSILDIRVTVIYKGEEVSLSTLKGDLLP